MEPRLGRIYRQRDYRLWGLQELWRNTPPRLTRPNNATSPFQTPSWGLSVIASWKGWVSDSGSLPRHIFTAHLGLQIQDCGQREDHKGPPFLNHVAFPPGVFLQLSSCLFVCLII